VCPFMNSLLPFFQGQFCHHFVKFERTRLPWVMLAKLVEVLVGCCKASVLFLHLTKIHEKEYVKT
jgi:hypothetical protein